MQTRMLLPPVLVLLMAAGACGGSPANPDRGPAGDDLPVALPEVVQPDAAGPRDEGGPEAGDPATADPAVDAAPDPGADPDTDPGADPGADPAGDPGVPDDGGGSVPDDGPADVPVPDPGPADEGPRDTGAPDAGCAAPCEAGSTCVAGTCLPCDSDLRCGASCRPCSGKATHCLEGRCVQCLADEECLVGWFCREHACTQCGTVDDPLHCGRLCAPCEGEAPACVGAACVCDASSCGAGRRCLDGACAACDVAEACGQDCVVCPADHPWCVEGSRCAACRDDADCGSADLQCSGGECVPSCRPPDGACSTAVGGPGETCADALVVGRTGAGSAQGADVAGDTSWAYNDDEVPNPDCWDANADQMVRVWLAAGETLHASLAVWTWEADLVLKAYTRPACAADLAGLAACVDQAGAGGVESLEYVATADGWVWLVVDGATSYNADYGAWDLLLKVDCKRADCCCAP